MVDDDGGRGRMSVREFSRVRTSLLVAGIAEQLTYLIILGYVWIRTESTVQQLILERESSF